MAITCWLTTADRRVLLQQQEEILLEDISRIDDSYLKIHLDTTQTYQSIDGFGFALTGGSAYLINQLSAATRDDLLREIFSTDNYGIGTNYLRISIGASDLSAITFSYNDVAAIFDLNAGDRDLIPVLHEIIEINPQLKILGTPWSAPPWMKTNGNFIGGKLSPNYYQAYAHYFVQYLRAMQAHGITIKALTIQNEPLNSVNEPSMVMDALEQAEFIKNYLGPSLRDAGFQGVELFCWDHNCDLKEYPLTVLADSQARGYLTGVAWHLYGGDVSAIADVHQVYPAMKMAFTEQWVGVDGKFADDLKWHIKNVLIGTIKNWSAMVLEWNLASDPDCGPHTPKGAAGCVGALTIDINSEKIVRNVSYYVIAHAAKFISPGSLRIFSSQVDLLPNVAFKTPNSEIVVIVLNDNHQPQTFIIQLGAQAITTTLAGGAVGTYIWKIIINAT